MLVVFWSFLGLFPLLGTCPDPHHSAWGVLVWLWMTSSPVGPIAFMSKLQSASRVKTGDRWTCEISRIWYTCRWVGIVYGVMFARVPFRCDRCLTCVLHFCGYALCLTFFADGTSTLQPVEDERAWPSPAWRPTFVLNTSADIIPLPSFEYWIPMSCIEWLTSHFDQFMAAQMSKCRN